MAQRLTGLEGVHYIWVVLAVTTLTIFLTEVTAAMATSFAFMLPVATPLNAIAFGSGYLDIATMAKVGF